MDREAKPADNARNYELDRVERACLQMNADGLENRKIGACLKLSEKDVERHLLDAQRKLGATNRLQAIIIGLKKGLIDIDGHR